MAEPTPLHRPNMDHWQERVDMAAAFRWTERLGMHEAVANHFSLAVSEDGTEFLMNPNQIHFSRVKASNLLHLDAKDKDTLSKPGRTRSNGLGTTWVGSSTVSTCALRYACAFNPCNCFGMSQGQPPPTD